MRPGFNQSQDGVPSSLNHEPFRSREDAVAWLENLGGPRFVFIERFGYWQTADGYVDAKPRSREGIGHWWEFLA